jgi:hypothetical protein
MHLESVMKKLAVSVVDSYSFVSKFMTYVQNKFDLYFKRSIIQKFELKKSENLSKMFKF